MKLRSFFHLLGLKPRSREYDTRLETFHLPQDGVVEYAQWLHPKDTPKQIRQQAVDSLREFINPGDVALDIGAHSGDSTLPMALAAGRTGRVFAFEPNPYVFRVLQQNAGLNQDKTHIVPYAFAATLTDGPIEFEYSDPGFCNGGRHEGVSRWKHGHAFALTVQGRNLDAFLRTRHAESLPKLRYIKVDAEGYDPVVVESLRPLLTEFRPVLKTEIFKLLKRTDRQQFLSRLAEMGYRCFRLIGETEQPAERIDEGNVHQWEHFDLLCLPEAKARPGVAAA